MKDFTKCKSCRHYNKEKSNPNWQPDSYSYVEQRVSDKNFKMRTRGLVRW